MPLLAASCCCGRPPTGSSSWTRCPVAIVNNDTVVTKPTTVAAGRSLTASLTDPTSSDPTDPKLDWTLTDTDDAEQGLRSGKVLRGPHHPLGLLERDRVDKLATSPSVAS